MTTPDHPALLDQLQAQVNLVLEQTGRVFAAVDLASKKPPTAQVNKLKQVLPRAQGNFHDALDQLEEELQLAQLVMRRDLALLRERHGIPAEPTDSAVQHATAELQDPVPAARAKSEAAPAGEKVDLINSAPAEDVIMGDAPLEPQPGLTELPKSDISQKPDMDTKDATLTGATKSSTDDTSSSSETAAKREPATSTDSDAKPSEAALQINTSESKPISDNEKAPDTAKESINNDLDSLFGGGDNANDAGNDFSFDENATSEIDFGDFGNFNGDNGENDNISSLLPGLEDYANTQSNNNSGAELDLNAFFTNTNEQNDKPTQNSSRNNNNNNNNNKPNNNANNEPRDTTFDDLMDLANFDGNMGDDDDDGNNHNNAAADLDFDALFN